MKMFRISVREATPEADLYNYNFKDKWEKSVEEGGLPKKYDKYDMNGYRKDHRVKNIKFTSNFDPNASDNSAFGKGSSCDPNYGVIFFSYRCQV